MASVGSEGQEGFVALGVLSLVYGGVIDILQEIVSVISGHIDEHGNKTRDFLDDFSFADDAVNGFKSHLVKKCDYYKAVRPSGHSFMLYNEKDFEGIYAHYVGEPEKKKELINNVSRAIFTTPGLSILSLRNAFQSNDLSLWEKRLIEKSKSQFAGISKDYHVLKVLNNKYGGNLAAFLGTVVHSSGFWARQSANGAAYRLNDSQRLMLIGIPSVNGVDSLYKADENFKREINKIQTGFDYCTIDEDSSEIIFYQAAGGFPISFPDGLPDLRKQYFKLRRQGQHLHINRNDYIYRDIALLEPYEQKALVDSRKISVIGIGLKEIDWKKDAYNYLDVSQVRNLPISLGNWQELNSKLLADSVLRDKVLRSLSKKLDAIYSSKDQKLLANWYAFLCQLVKDYYGKKWGVVISELELDFDDSMAVRIIEAEKKTAEGKIRGNFGDELFGKIQGFADSQLNIIARCEDPYKRSTEVNPYPKRREDNKRTFPDKWLRIILTEPVLPGSTNIASAPSPAPVGSSVPGVKLCIKCKKEIPADMLFCGFCGSNPDSATIPPFAPAPSPVPRPVDISCPKCNRTLAQGMLYCGYCGARVGSLVQGVKLCINCKKEIPANGSFCVFCGTDQSSTPNPVPAPSSDFTPTSLEPTPCPDFTPDQSHTSSDDDYSFDDLFR